MLKKLIAGVVVAGILSTGSMVLANSLQGNQKGAASFCVVPVEETVGPMQRMHAATVIPIAAARSFAVRDAEELQSIMKVPYGLQKKIVDFGIEIAGLSFDEIKEKIKEARKERIAANQLEKLQERAAALGIDTTGLSAEELRAKIAEVLKAKETADLLAQLKERAAALGIDTTGLNAEEIKAKIVEVLKARETADLLAQLKERAAALGIDTTGLSIDEIKAKIIEALKERWSVDGFARWKIRFGDLDIDELSIDEIREKVIAPCPPHLIKLP
ncbi:MAG TPA: hypothetical protein GXX49_02055 [Clostridiaceae bacterium]|nr:hypothetical protein [Clostridiaceae bacterium]